MTKPVQLSDEAYGRLKNAKRPQESFSDVVLRLTQAAGKLPFDGLIGLLTHEEAKWAKKALREADRLDREDVRRAPKIDPDDGRRLRRR